MNAGDPSENDLQNRELIVAVTGGIAAYKTADLVSKLVQAGAGVQVVMTAAAKRFVGPATFAALTGRPVAIRGFAAAAHPLGPHIELAERAELLCVAPATADFIARAAHGLADDLLGTLLLAFTGPVLIAPAMNADMWDKPALQRNLAQLRQDGFQIIDPQSGWLSCRRRGVGRMADPADIRAAITGALPKKS